MATISNKSTTPSSESTTSAKWPFAKKIVETNRVSKTTTNKAATIQTKKAVAAASEKLAATPVKKVSTPKVEKPAIKQAWSGGSNQNDLVLQRLQWNTFFQYIGN